MSETWPDKSKEILQTLEKTVRLKKARDRNIKSRSFQIDRLNTMIRLTGSLSAIIILTMLPLFLIFKGDSTPEILIAGTAVSAILIAAVTASDTRFTSKLFGFTLRSGEVSDEREKNKKENEY